MKKLMLIAGAAAAISAASAITPANAGFKGCCGGWNPGGGGFHHHWHGGFGGGFGVGIVDAGFGVGGDCYYVRRAVVVPGIGLVRKRQLVCS